MVPRSGDRRSERVLLSFGFAPQVLPALQLAEWLTGYRAARDEARRAIRPLTAGPVKDSLETGNTCIR